MKQSNFQLKPFIIITLITSIWVNIGEMMRGSLVAFPRMEAFFGDQFSIIGSDTMTMSHSIIWIGWNMLLTIILVFIFWLCAKAFGNNLKTVFIAGTTTCLATLGIFWIATVNTGLGEWSTAFILIALAWFELIIGAWIASKLYSTKLFQKD